MRRVKELVRLFGPSEVEKLKEKKDVEGLIRKLETGKPKEQTTAAYALGEIGDERATEPLIRLLERVGTAGDVCIACVNALGKLGDDRAIEALVRALSDNIRGSTSPIGLLLVPVALAAAHALASIGKPTVEPLIKALGSEIGCMRVYARRALEMIGEPAVDPLKKALTNENKYVRETAGKILKDMRA
jgi:HEAT repeat protein